MNKIMIASMSVMAAALLAGGTASAAPNATPLQQVNPPPQQEGQQEQPPPPPNAPRQQDNKRGPGQRRGPIIEARVQSVSGNAITLDVKNPRDTAGPVITVNDSTAYYVPGVSNATIANIKSGDHVAILIDKNASSESTRIANAVSVLPLPQSALVAGQVSNVSESGFTLTGPRSEEGKVNVAGAKVIVPGKATAGMNDIQNGARVAVQGKPTGDKAVDATLIVVAPQNRDNVFAGLIAAINGNTITLFTREGEQVKVDASNAVIFERGDSASTMADLKVGRGVAVIGIKNSEGSVTAQLIGQADLPFFGR